MKSCSSEAGPTNHRVLTLAHAITQHDAPLHRFSAWAKQESAHLLRHEELDGGHMQELEDLHQEDEEGEHEQQRYARFSETRQEFAAAAAGDGERRSEVRGRGEKVVREERGGRGLRQDVKRERRACHHAVGWSAPQGRTRAARRLLRAFRCSTSHPTQCPSRLAASVMKATVRGRQVFDHPTPHKALLSCGS